MRLAKKLETTLRLFFKSNTIMCITITKHNKNFVILAFIFLYNFMFVPLFPCKP